jgi:hypothetical protein
MCWREIRFKWGGPGQLIDDIEPNTNDEESFAEDSNCDESVEEFS